MTSNRDRLGGFEERLLDELKSVVAHRKAEQSTARPARAPLWRRRSVVSVASAGALAIGAAIGLPLLGGSLTAPSASAAFELTTNDDGTITVTIYRFDDADGLEAQLADHGVQADVTQVPNGEHCQPDRYELSPTQHQVGVDNPTPAGVPLNMNDVQLSFTLRPADFQPDETLVVANEWAGADTDPPKAGAVQLFQLVHFVTAIGPVEPCELEAD
jgi:hypothetical protein